MKGMEATVVFFEKIKNEMSLKLLTGGDLE